MKKILIHYFSGTGNTYHMTKKLEEAFVQKGDNVDFVCMSDNVEKLCDDYDINIFSYPVYAFGTPSLILNYMNNIRSRKSLKACILITCGGFEGKALVQSAKILKNNGFNIFFTHAFIYPDNFTQVTKPMDEAKAEKMFEIADIEVLKIADKIINEVQNIKRLGMGHLIWTSFVSVMFNLFGRRVLGKSYIADKDCIGCAKCEAVCPSGTIKMNGGKPCWSWSCEACQRCMNICPTKAIGTSTLKLVKFLLIGFIPLFVVAKLNNYYDFGTGLNFLTDIVLFILLNFVLYYLGERLIFLSEKIGFIRRLFESSFTKKYRKYFVKGFKI